MPPNNLQSPEVDALETERRVQELLNEVVGRYFNGTPHTRHAAEVTFPHCDLFFNQASLPQPAPRPQIHFVFTDLRPIQQDWTGTDRVVTCELIVTIFVRVAVQGGAGDRSDHLARRIAAYLKTIFEDTTDTYALARKNLRHPRVMRGPVAMQSSGFQARMLTVRCQPRYFVPRTTSDNPAS